VTVDAALLALYAKDDSHRAPRALGAFSGAAGAPCAAISFRVSVVIADGVIDAVTFDAEGCAAATAPPRPSPSCRGRARAPGGRDSCGARVGDPRRLSPQGRHAADLAADALHRALSSAASSGVALADGPPNDERVLVAMSGGVDSAVAALLEREAGRGRGRGHAQAVGRPAQRRRSKLLLARGCDRCPSAGPWMGIPHLTLDLEEAFRSRVVGEFVRGYGEGRTPNPCVICNGDLRIDAMLALADRLGASTLATGHYARSSMTGRPAAGRGERCAKDQTYMLSALRPATIERLRFRSRT